MDACKQPVHACLATTWCTHAWPTLPGAICINALSTQDPNRTTCASCIFLHLPASACIYEPMQARAHSDMRACACVCMQGRLECSCARTNGVEDEGRTVMGAAKGMVRRQIQGVQGVSPPLVRSRCLCPLVLSGLSRGAVCVSATLSRGAWCPCPLVLSGLLQVRGHLSPPILLCLSEPISPYLTLSHPNISLLMRAADGACADAALRQLST